MKWIVATLALALAPQVAHALDLQGHRGARGLAPENTLQGFAHALGIGVTTLELDIAITEDGVLVISHDPALNPDLSRGPDGRFLEARGPLIRDLAFEQLSRYDVGRLKPAMASDDAAAVVYQDRICEAESADCSGDLRDLFLRVCARIVSAGA